MGIADLFTTQNRTVPRKGKGPLLRQSAWEFRQELRYSRCIIAPFHPKFLAQFALFDDVECGSKCTGSAGATEIGAALADKSPER